MDEGGVKGAVVDGAACSALFPGAGGARVPKDHCEVAFKAGCVVFSKRGCGVLPKTEGEAPPTTAWPALRLSSSCDAWDTRDGCSDLSTCWSAPRDSETDPEAISTC